MTDIQTQIVAAAGRYGVDPALALAVAHQESGFNQAAVSPAGAIGVMQLMPATARGLGVDPHDTAGNIDGGVKLLSQLLDRYKGDQALALAAYNAGPAAVAKYGGVPPFAETENYVSRILGSVGGWLGIVATAPAAVDDSTGYSAADDGGVTLSSPAVIVAGAALLALLITEFT